MQDRTSVEKKAPDNGETRRASGEKLFELFVEKLAAGGEGLGFLEGKAVFVPLSVPGERLLCAPVEEKPGYMRAQIVEILQASENRIAPPCPHYTDCGGCELQHIRYEEQLSCKIAILRENLSRIGKIDAPEILAVPSVPFAYRNRMQLHLSPRGRIGFMRRNSSRIVEVDTCPVAVPEIRDFIENRAGSALEAKAIKPRIVGKERFLVFGTESGLMIEGRDTVVVVTVLERKISFHIKGFFQSNLHMLNFLAQAVAAGLSGTRVLDLFCGVGTFGVFLADNFAETISVEQDPYSIEFAKANLSGQGKEFSAMACEDWTKTEAARRPIDAVVLDPPRSGLSPDLRTWLGEKMIPRLRYVSCNPSTLSRDLSHLVRAGYRVVSLKIFDFFPQTAHIETLAELEA